MPPQLRPCPARGEEGEVAALVAEADAVVDDGAMMVVTEDAATAELAVL